MRSPGARGHRRAAGRVLSVPRRAAGGCRDRSGDRARGEVGRRRNRVPETPDGRRVFYDINANSNLRPAIAEAFGFYLFDRVVTFLSREVEKSRS